MRVLGPPKIVPESYASGQNDKRTAGPLIRFEVESESPDKIFENWTQLGAESGQNPALGRAPLCDESGHVS